MLKRITLILMVALLPLIAMAQTVKLGYINSQEVMMMMPEVNDVEKQLADFNEKNMKYLQDMEKEIQDKYIKYEQEKAKLRTLPLSDKEYEREIKKPADKWRV